jgi:hypothetical protein
VVRKYLFADESGNFDFRSHTQFPNGPSRYFSVGTIMVEGDDALGRLDADLLKLKRDLAWKNVVHDSAFHATEDPQNVRDHVFDTLDGHDFRVDVTLVEKSKAQAHLRADDVTFYRYAWWFHFRAIANWLGRINPGDELMVAAAALGTKRRKQAFKGAVEDVVNQCLHVKIARRVTFWPVEAQPGLQAADYCVWAVHRAWERGDDRAKKQVGDKLRSEYDFFQHGRTHYY